MSKRDQALNAQAELVLSRMLDEIAMDIAIQTHREVRRSQVLCPVCYTHCTSDHSSSHSATAEDSAKVSGASNAKGDSSIMLECTVCKRQIASNRYAPHLSQCLGMGARKGAARTATAKTASETPRSASPFIGSETGTVSDELPVAKPKGKSKAKKTEDAEFNLHRRKSPVSSPTKKSQRTKLAAPGPISRVPSKLRESSFASLAEQGQEGHAYSPGSRDSSPEEPFATPTSTAYSAQSPKSAKRKGGVLPGYTPTPAPPVHVPQPDYLGGDGGDETGSSTDTDSS